MDISQQKIAIFFELWRINTAVLTKNKTNNVKVTLSQVFYLKQK